MSDAEPRKQSPLDHLDAGWCFLISGLALIAAMTLIPPSDDLAGLNYRRDRLLARERDSIAKLDAYTTFLDAVNNRDPDLVRRLAASQLNVIPAESEPVGIIGNNLDAYVDHWINRTLPAPESVSPPIVKDSLLRRLSQPGTKLWVIVGGAVLIFVGLLPQTEETESEEGILDQSEETPSVLTEIEDTQNEFMEEYDDETEPVVAHELVEHTDWGGDRLDSQPSNERNLFEFAQDRDAAPDLNQSTEMADEIDEDLIGFALQLAESHHASLIPEKQPKAASSTHLGRGTKSRITYPARVLKSGGRLPIEITAKQSDSPGDEHGNGETLLSVSPNHQTTIDDAKNAAQDDELSSSSTTN